MDQAKLNYFIVCHCQPRTLSEDSHRKVSSQNILSEIHKINLACLVFRVRKVFLNKNKMLSKNYFGQIVFKGGLATPKK